MWKINYMNDEICTFKPKISDHKSFHSNNKKKSFTEKIKSMSLPKELKGPYKDPECTFKPRRQTQSISKI